MAGPTYRVHTIAFSYDERSDWAVQSYLNAEAENNYLLDRVIMTDRGQLDQKFKYWVIITKLVDSSPSNTNSGHSDSALGQTPGSD